MKQIGYFILKFIPWVLLVILVLLFPIVMIVWHIYSNNETENTKNREGSETKQEYLMKLYNNFLKNRCKDFFNSPSGPLDRELKVNEDLKTIDGKIIPKLVYLPMGNYLLIAPCVAVIWVLDTILHVSTTCLEDYTCFNQSNLMAEPISSCSEVNTCFNQSDLMAEPISSCSEVNETASVLCYKAIFDFEQALANIGGATFASYSMLRLSSILAKLIGSCYCKVRYCILGSVVIVVVLFGVGFYGFRMDTTLGYFKLVTYVGFLPMVSLIPWENLYGPENTETNTDQLQQNSGGGGAVATGQGINSCANDSQNGHVSLDLSGSSYDNYQGEKLDYGHAGSSHNGVESRDWSTQGNGLISSIIRKQDSSGEWFYSTLVSEDLNN